MTLRLLALLACLAFVLVFTPFPSNAEFLNEDLVFEEHSSLPSWRTEKNRRLIYDKNRNSLEDSGYSESDSGLWDRTVHTFRRIKRGFWDLFEDVKTTESAESTTKSGGFTPDQDTSNTLSRETRSTNDVDETSNTHHANSDLTSLTTDDDDYTAGGGTSGDDFSSGDIQPDLSLPASSTEDSFPLSPDSRVCHRVTITVDEPYTKEMADRNSEHFKEFSENFSTAVDIQLSNIPGVHKTMVINVEIADDVFKRIVTLDIITEGSSNEDEIKEELNEQIKTYRRIGSYGVSADHFSFRKFGACSGPAPQSCSPGDIQCPTHFGGNCVTNAARCNGTLECIDGWDEEGCPSTESSTTKLDTLPYHSVIVKDKCSDGDQVHTCADGSTTICESQKCDGKPDCPGNDDESGCTPECLEFACDVTKCIPKHEVCDGIAQCEDKTDEQQNCPTEHPTTSNKTERDEATSNLSVIVDRCRADDKVRCGDGSTYICDDQKCDGKADCPDGDDENNCSHECSFEEFQCDTNRCIPLKEVCDRITQCDDRTDELNCASKGKRDEALSGVT